MKKVIFVILGLDFSGAENVLIQYLDGNSEIDPYFAFIYEGNAAQHFSERFGASKVFQLKLSYIKNELRFLPKITQYRLKHALMTVIEQLRPDAFYFNNTHEVILSRKIVRELKVPCIGHVHDMQASIGTVCKRYEAKRVFDELDVVLTVSEACKKSWNCNRMKVVYNGVSDDYFTTDKLIKKNDPIVVGYVGMISKRKGFDILVKVIESMGDNIKWKIAYNLVEDSCQDLLNCIKDKKNVQFFLRLNSSEMKAFYDAIDILLVPSRQDPLPTVAIEAMARKKLVLGSNTGGIPELLGSKRYLFKVEDSSSIETMLSEYCNKDTYEFSSYVEEQWQRAYGLFRSFSKRTYVNSIISGQLKEDRV